MDKSLKIKIRDLTFSYQKKKVLRNISIDFQEREITAISGPSGSGKSTLLATLNRLWETAEGGSLQGTIEIRIAEEWRDIYQHEYSVTHLRRQVGMVFQTPNPLPMSIYKNVAFPLKLADIHNTSIIRERVEEVLKMVGLWREVEKRLDASALQLSGGQQQRLCIARAMILRPEVLLLDEPTSSLDHQAVTTIENLLTTLKKYCTVLMISHDREQIQRVADNVIQLDDGKVITPTLSSLPASV